MSICSYGNSKKEAYSNILKAKKQKKFKHRKGDWFSVKYETQEENYTKLRRKGLSRNLANVLSLHGHTTYIVKDNNVYIN